MYSMAIVTLDTRMDANICLPWHFAIKYIFFLLEGLFEDLAVVMMDELL